MFVSFIKPHKAVTSSKIARWLRSILEHSGIDPSIFGAHSTRGASAMRGGITTKDILKAGAQSQSSRNSTTKKWTKHHMVERLLTRIAWSKLQMTQLMCETEPSESRRLQSYQLSTPTLPMEEEELIKNQRGWQM